MARLCPDSDCCPSGNRRAAMKSVFVRSRGINGSDRQFSLEEGNNLFTGAEDFRRMFGVLTSLEEDLLLLGSSIFAADRACARGEREDYQRHIDITIPVVNVM